MTTKNFIVATAGHVDHGKSSLVKALTGTDPDRLPEEKARGITIDLGFAHLQLRRGDTLFNLGLVDVPGHEDFVKNMVAGVGSIDLALLVVAADDGWMPQTEEHFQILSYLRVQRLIVALTKIDLAQNESDAIENVRAKLADSLFANATIVPTSVVASRGLEELKTAFIETLSSVPLPRNIGKPRLPVDRVFTLQGVGVVVTGTLAGGELRQGQPVIIQPSGRRARIRRIHTYNESVEVSGPGKRTALNLSDIGANEIQRGDSVTTLEGGSSSTWDVLLERSPRAAGRALKDGATIRVHFGSANAPARVILLDAKMLSSGQKLLAQLRFDHPVFAFAGDAFLIRDSTEQSTLGGGIVLCQNAERRHAHALEHQKCLQARAAAPDQAGAFIVSQLQRDGFAQKSELLSYSRFSEDEITTALAHEKSIHATGNLIADRAWWQQIEDHAINLIDAAHRARPDQSGLPLNDLRAALEIPDEVFAALLSELNAKGFAQSGVNIARSSHRLALPPEIEKSAARVRSALAAKLLDPPSEREIAPDAATRQALTFLIKTGEVLQLSNEIVMLADGYARAADEVRRFLTARASATTSELRQLLGSSRRVIIPLLEYLDKHGVTRRDADRRVLKQQ